MSAFLVRLPTRKVSSASTSEFEQFANFSIPRPKLYSTMRTLLVLLTIGLVCLVINAQKQESPRNPIIGQTFDEIVVSSDLNIRRKSKENRQGKALLSNIPSGTTGPPEKPTAVASKLVSDDGIRVAPEKREKRETTTTQERYFDLGLAGYLLKSRKR